MELYIPYKIKSFKHDGHLHRMWLQNWLVPDGLLHSTHQREKMHVIINDQTIVQEGDGNQWISRIPAVSFFIPKKWFNIVALLEGTGVRYYCNVASPPYVSKDVITYIDYDFDVIRLANGDIRVVDEDEYEIHRLNYSYSEIVEEKVKKGLSDVLERMNKGDSPFHDEIAISYYEHWKTSRKDQ